jgi:HEAT repeat protein
MNSGRNPLALRRAELIGLCAQQRAGLAQELALLPAPLTIVGLRGRLAANNKLILTVAGVALGLVAMRPKRLLAAAAGALSLLRTVRSFLPLLQR